MRKSLGVILFVSAALVAAACGGKGAPTAPTPASPTTPATPTAATITGSVQNASAGATVAVDGTAMTTGLDSAGRFTLSNVPTGNVQLRVTSGGATSMVPITAVLAAQTVEVVVTLSGAVASVESEVRHGAGEAELKGVIEALPPATAAATFKAAGKTVTTNASTVFVNGGVARTFADLKLRMRVEVKGTMSGDTVTATRVGLEDGAAPVPNPTPAPAPGPTEAEFTGAMDSLSGTAASFQFKVGSRVVKGDGSTAIIGSSNTVKSFADLKNGSVVEVKGVQRDGFVQASRIHVEGPETEHPDDNGAAVEVEGTLGAVSGTCPGISSSVGGTRFTTSSSTEFDGTACTVFKSGDKVQVKGVKKSDGSLTATRLRKK